MIKGFRDFIMRGSVVDLAVGIVVGAAFSALINQFVRSFINPLVKLITGGRQASGQWRVTDAVVFDWGAFVNQVIVFLITAGALYFAVVVPINKLNELRLRGREPEPEELSKQELLLTEIRDSLQPRP
jgi:large conductance mechanosensitive channel